MTNKLNKIWNYYNGNTSGTSFAANQINEQRFCIIHNLESLDLNKLLELKARR